MPTPPTPKITPLTEADRKRMRKQRAAVEKYLANADSKQRFTTTMGKLGTIRALLQALALHREQTSELQCLGVVLGDTFVHEFGMEWIMVEDDHGQTPAVQLPGTTMILFPLTMICKRSEGDDHIDVYELFKEVATQVDELQQQGTRDS